MMYFILSIVALSFFFWGLNNKKLLKEEKVKVKILAEKIYPLEKDKEDSCKIIDILLSTQEGMAEEIYKKEEDLSLLRDKSLAIGNVLARKVTSLNLENKEIKGDLRTARLGYSSEGY